MSSVDFITRQSKREYEYDSKCNEEDEGGEGEKPATETSQMETNYCMDSTQICNE